MHAETKHKANDSGYALYTRPWISHHSSLSFICFMAKVQNLDNKWHCGPSSQNYEWATAHPGHAAVPPSPSGRCRWSLVHNSSVQMYWTVTTRYLGPTKHRLWTGDHFNMSGVRHLLSMFVCYAILFCSKYIRTAFLFTGNNCKYTAWPPEGDLRRGSHYSDCNGV